MQTFAIMIAYFQNIKTRKILFFALSLNATAKDSFYKFKNKITLYEKQNNP